MILGLIFVLQFCGCKKENIEDCCTTCPAVLDTCHLYYKVERIGETCGLCILEVWNYNGIYYSDGFNMLYKPYSEVIPSIIEEEVWLDSATFDVPGLMDYYNNIYYQDQICDSIGYGINGDTVLVEYYMPIIKRTYECHCD